MAATRGAGARLAAASVLVAVMVVATAACTSSGVLHTPAGAPNRETTSVSSPDPLPEATFPSSPDSPPPPTTPTTPPTTDNGVLGAWSGTYMCGQGLTDMTLAITRGAGTDGVQARFTFYADATNPTVATGSGILQGTYSAGRLALIWERFTQNPGGYIGVDFNGSVSGAGAQRTLSGTVTALPGGSPCSTFTLTPSR